jgi:hypothetical protein
VAPNSTTTCGYRGPTPGEIFAIVAILVEDAHGMQFSLKCASVTMSAWNPRAARLSDRA